MRRSNWSATPFIDYVAVDRYNESLRRDGGQLIARLVRKRRLRPGLTRRRARDIMLTLLGPHVFFVFTTELGWSSQQFAAWANRALLWELFDLGRPGL